MFGLKKKKIIPPSASELADDTTEEPTTTFTNMVGPVTVVETSPSVKKTASDGSEDSKKKALLESDDPEYGDDELNKPSAEDKPVHEKVMEHMTVAWASVLGFCGLPKVLAATLLAGAAVGTVTILLASRGIRSNVKVAFVGNSYFYVNDLPRFVENIGKGHVYQDSCLHNSASILEIIMTGNGMWNAWATPNAMIGGVKYETQSGDTAYLYDMGACSVPQLLTGHDSLVSSGDILGTFVNDGENPCFNQDAYLEYQESFDYRGGWDFVVLTDQAKTMSYDDTRLGALAAFNYTYGPILKKNKISPIIVQPHAYAMQYDDSTELSDINTFTALIMEGAVVYKKYLEQRVGWFNHAHIAPVGNAFLAVREVDQSLYQKLFLDDGIHPSAHGTYLYGMVIYATMTGKMPRYKDVVVSDVEGELFSTARRLQASYSQAGFPSKSEAATLFKIAKKVALKGYKPKALRGFKTETDAQEYIEEEVSVNYYDGDEYTVDYSSQGNYNQYYDNGNYENGDDYVEVNQDDAQNNGNENAEQNYQAQYGGNYGYNGQYGGN